MRRVALTFETTPPASARRVEPGQAHGVAGERDAGLLHHALRQIGELLVRIAPVDPRQRRAAARARRGGSR